MVTLLEGYTHKVCWENSEQIETKQTNIEY